MRARASLLVVVASASLACGFGFGAVPPVNGLQRDAARPGVGKVVAAVRIPSGPGGLAVGEGAVWAASDSVTTLMRIDPDRNVVAATIKMKLTNACSAEPPGCGEAAAGDGAVWVTHTTDDTVSRVNPDTNFVTATIKVGRRPRQVAVSPGAVWVANSGGPTISRIDPSTNRVAATIRVGPASAASEFLSIAAGAGAVWAGVPSLSAVMRIDPVTNAVVSTVRRAGRSCGFMVASRNAVWSAGAHCDDSVARINPHSNRRSSKVKGPLFTPIGLALGFGSLWIADLDAKALDRVNVRTGRIVARRELGGYPVRVASGFGSIWIRDDTGRVLRIAPRR